MDCEWHFFATSHGKNACDGIGGTVKRATARASLQRTTERQILTPEDMFKFCEENLSKTMKFFFVTASEFKEVEQQIEHRFKDRRAIPGTQKFHRFVPINKEELMVHPISSGIGSRKRIRKVHSKPERAMVDNMKSVKPGEYVSCISDKQVWFGIVEEYCEEFDDYKLNVLHPSGSSGAGSYHYPSIKD